MSRKTPGEVRARTCGTKSPSRSEALRFIDSSKSPSTKIDGSLVNFRRRKKTRETTEDVDMDIRRKHRSDCEHVNVIRTSRVLSPDRTWPDRWLSEMHESRKVGLGTTAACRLESLRLKFTNEPSIFVDGDLDESIKRSASDRLGNLVPQVRARTSPGVFRDMALLGLCLELSFNVLKKAAEERKWTKTFLFRNRWLFGPKFTVCTERNVLPSLFLVSFFVVARFPVGDNTSLLPCGSNTGPAQGASGKHSRDLLSLFERRDVYPRQTMRPLRKVCHARRRALSSWQQTQTKLSLQDVGLVVFLNLAKTKSLLP